MLEDNIGSLLENFYTSVGLPYVVFTSGREVLYTVPNIPPSVDASYYDYIIQDFHLQKRDMGHPLVMVFDNDYMVGTAQLEEDTYLMVGPVSSTHKKREDYMRFCAPVIPEDRLVRFCDKLMTLPIFSVRQFSTAFSLAIFLCCGRQIDPVDMVPSNSAAPVSENDQTKVLFAVREDLDWHIDQSFEDGVCAAVESGDTELLKRKLGAASRGRVGVMSVNPVSQAKYTFIAFATLLSRAAIRGGLSQEAAFSLADIYCQQMDRVYDIASIDTLSYKMAMGFCSRVGELKKQNRFTPPVRKCVDYIDRHLHEAIRLSDIAEECGLCTRSISAKFREETGTSISDYISSERIREAKYLLLHSDYSLAEISSILQYNSQSYFTQKFRVACGETPQRYRDSHRKG